MAKQKWTGAFWGGHWTYVFGKSPVLERIENDQGFVSTVEKQGHISSISEIAKRCTELPTVVGLHANKVRNYGGEIASANPLHRPSHQHPGKTRYTNRLGLHSVLNHLDGSVSCAIKRGPQSNAHSSFSSMREMTTILVLKTNLTRYAIRWKLGSGLVFQMLNLRAR